MDPEIKNHMYESVLSLAPEVFATLNVCECKRCRLDAIAIALNNLPSKYVVTDMGSAIASVESELQENKAKLYGALSHAAILVSQNPRHG